MEAEKYGEMKGEGLSDAEELRTAAAAAAAIFDVI